MSLWRPRLLTYDEAAQRVGVDPWTIKQWRRDGMSMGTDPRGRRVVREDVLLEWRRTRRLADPSRPRISPGVSQPG